MALSFLPGNPNTGNPDSFFMKSWFKAITNFCKAAFGLADVQITSFSATDQEFYPCLTSGGSMVATLPTALGTNGKPYTFKKTSGLNTLTIVPSGSDTIEGAVSYTMTANGATVTFRSDGQGTWYIHSVGGTTGFLASPLTTKGDIWGYSTVDARIPVGSNTFVLTADSSQALGVKWAAPAVYATSPLNTKGDLWGFSTLDARVPVGANNTVLTADSTQALGVKWATPSAGSPAGADTQIQFNDGGSAFGADADFTWDKTNNILTFGTSSHMAMDMTNATIGNRFYFTNTVVNGNGALYVVPNGSATQSSWRALSANSLSTAQPYCAFGQVTSVSFMDANVLNAGSQGTLELRIGGAAAVAIDTSKDVQFKAGESHPVVTKTGSYGVTLQDSVIFADCTSGSLTLTLPAANAAGAGFSQRIRIKRIDNSLNTVTVARAGADTIDGSTSYVLGAYQAVDLESDGTSKWGIM